MGGRRWRSERLNSGATAVNFENPGRHRRNDEQKSEVMSLQADWFCLDCRVGMKWQEAFDLQRHVIGSKQPVAHRARGRPGWYGFSNKEHS